MICLCTIHHVDYCRSLWEETNNTVGFNHMVASASDAANYNPQSSSTVALAMETMYGYTAYFADNDPRFIAYSHNKGGDS